MSLILIFIIFLMWVSVFFAISKSYIFIFKQSKQKISTIMQIFTILMFAFWPLWIIFFLKNLEKNISDGEKNG